MELPREHLSQANIWAQPTMGDSQMFKFPDNLLYAAVADLDLPTIVRDNVNEKRSDILWTPQLSVQVHR
jgi:hypothetical protein